VQEPPETGSREIRSCRNTVVRIWSARSLRHLISFKPCVRGRQADAEASDGQTQQDLARLEQVCDLRCAEQLELGKPDGVLLRSCRAGAVKLRVVYQTFWRASRRNRLEPIRFTGVSSRSSTIAPPVVVN
jgi:hypothetical protein